MGKRGNPYDNAKVESFMKTLKVEAVYPMAFETFDDIIAHLPRFIDNIYTQIGCIQHSVISAHNSLKSNTSGRWSKQQPDPVRLKGRTPARHSFVLLLTTARIVPNYLTTDK